MASVAEFLVERLANAGVKHLFGTPGVFINPFFNQVKLNSSIVSVFSVDENHAALSAGAYSRVNGIGCVCVDYNVGALKICNAIAAAYSERSPVIVISGSPSIKDRTDDSFFHHVVKNFDNQLKVFKSLTCFSTILDDPTTAGWNIDRAIESLRFKKQPVYIELPLDVAQQPLRYDVYRQGTPVCTPTNQDNLNEAFLEVIELIRSANSPVIMAGVQISRFNLGDQLIRFAEKHNIPMMATLLSKSFVSENHRLFAGVFSGKDFTEDNLNKIIEESDCLLILGDLPTDLNFGFQSQRFAKKQMILCSSQGIKIKNHFYKDINFEDFCAKFFKFDFEQKKTGVIKQKLDKKEFVPTNTKITIHRFFEKISEVIKGDTAIISDAGELLKHTHSLPVTQNNFLSSAFYCSKDFVIPAIIGFSLSKQNTNVFGFIDDQGFEMSGFELKTLAKQNLSPIIFVLTDSEKNDEKNQLNVNYEKIIDIIGFGSSFRVETEEELCSNLDVALKSKKMSVINVILGRKE